ncbi:MULTISPECIES: hypothetical protein [Streptomyces]|uniref:hypothetical protein n=1 Tax=Streptomyces TaxID=1883 RepID=UPI00131CD22F|nr:MULTISPECIES: hypothetical protein [Streptomyces]
MDSPQTLRARETTRLELEQARRAAASNSAGSAACSRRRRPGRPTPGGGPGRLGARSEVNVPVRSTGGDRSVVCLWDFGDARNARSATP